MANPKVLLLGRYGHPQDSGGVANAMKNLIASAVEEGINFDVVSIRGKDSITEDLLATADYGLEGVDLTIVPAFKGFNSRTNDNFESATQSLTDIISANIKYPPGLIHVFTSYPNYLHVARRLSQHYGVPFMVSARGTDVYGHNPEYDYDQDKRWFLEPLNDASIITVLSDFLLKEMVQNLAYLGCNNQVIKKIHNGVDTVKFKPLDKVGIPENGLRVTYLGRIRGFKGILDIVKAVELARSDGVDVELDIYGDTGRGYGEIALTEIRNYINSHNLSDYVRCTGEYVPNTTLPEVYRKHNLFITASRCEGLPNAIMEAMSCGLAVALNYESGRQIFYLEPIWCLRPAIYVTWQTYYADLQQILKS